MQKGGARKWLSVLAPDKWVSLAWILAPSGSWQPRSCKQRLTTELRACGPFRTPGSFPWRLVAEERGNRAGGRRWLPRQSPPSRAQRFCLHAASSPGVLRDFLGSPKETGGVDVIITLCPSHCWDAVYSANGIQFKSRRQSSFMM